MPVVVQKYVESVALRKDVDPIVRVLAYGVLHAMSQSAETRTTCDYESIIDKYLSDEVFTVDVLFPDGRYRQLIYDYNISVSESVKQLAWTDGRENPERFALFEDRKDGCLVLDQTKPIVAVLNSEIAGGNCGQRRLRFRVVFSRVTEEEKSDSMVAGFSFGEWNVQYRQGKYHVQELLAAQLCVLQIQAHHDHSVFTNEQKLSELIVLCIPQAVNSLPWQILRFGHSIVQVFLRKSPAYWNKEVFRCFKKVGLIAQQKAQLQFLQVVRGLHCDNCLRCHVQTLRTSPLGLRPGTELRLVVSCSGMLLLRPEPYQCLLAILFNNILSYKKTPSKLSLHIQKENERLGLQFATDIGDRICKAISAHKSYWKNGEGSVHTRLQPLHMAAPSSAVMFDGDEQLKLDRDRDTVATPMSGALVEAMPGQSPLVEQSYSWRINCFMRSLNEPQMELDCEDSQHCRPVSNGHCPDDESRNSESSPLDCAPHMDKDPCWYANARFRFLIESTPHVGDSHARRTLLQHVPEADCLKALSLLASM